jgi:signal peptidase I
MKTIIKTNRALQWVLVGGMLAAVYAIINLGLRYLHLDSSLTAYVIQPLLWVAVILFSLWISDRRNAVKVRNRGSYVQLALTIGFIQVVAYAVGGLFSSFGKSPSAFTLSGILGNLVYIVTMLAGMELSRAWMVNHFGKKHIFPAVVFSAVFFTLLSQPVGKITGTTFSLDSIPNIGSTWLPVLGENLLASMLALFAGARASFLYRLLLAAFWWFCPILPDLQWTLKTLIGLLVPIMGMLLVNGYYTSQGVPGRPRRHVRQAAFPTGSIVTGIFCVGLIWFVSGALPFQPLLVPTGSMVPVYNPGDVVIVAKTSAANVRLNDVVEYRNPDLNINVVHRVIKIEDNAGKKTYITKGDANNAPDADPVPPENVVGKVVAGIPKVGWVAAIVKGFFIK